MIKSRQVLLKFSLDKYPVLENLLETGKYGFEIDDFYNPALMHDDESYKKRISEYQKIIKRYSDRIITMHGAFHSLTIHTKDPDFAEISKKKMIKSIQTATELNCRKVVFHAGIIPQSAGDKYDNIVKVHYDFWGELLEKYKDIEICIENVWELNTTFFEIILEKINSPRFSMCIDNGHVNAFSNTPLIEWTTKLKKHISHIHLNDNDKNADLHLALGEGQIGILDEIKELMNLKEELTYKIEIHTPEGIIKSIQFLIENGLLQL
jgi:sugar phosphate isomerase/epimerase